MRSPILLAAACTALLSLAASAEETSYGRDAVTAITDRIALKDCAGAVDDLKTGLKKHFPEVALLAGSMYENGICVKRDWDRAVPFYIQAWDGGIKEGADRLAAGYAAPENGADVAAALWWASRRRDKAALADAIPGCAVNPETAGDMDRFVAELQSWPQSRLVACNYMTGVMATIAAEVKYPTLAAMYNVGGDTTVRFLPGVPRIDLQKGKSSEVQMLGWIDGDYARERVQRSAGAFEQALGEVANRALRRYPHPDGIPADTLVKVQYHFEVQLGGR